MNFLKTHPFAVEAHFESSIVLTFAIPKEKLQHLIPSCVELDTFQDKWAFIALAMVKTKNLRPKGFPSFLGNNFFLLGYRIFVRYKSQKGRRLRGLYIIKSETDKQKMKVFGNIFTHYNYTTTDINKTIIDQQISIISKNSGLNIQLETSDNEIEMPFNSPFSTWKEARRFAGPLPFTFTFNEQKNEVLIIEGVRQNWKPKPIRVLNYKIDFLNSLNIEDIQLANAFEIQNVPYYWKKAKKEKWD